MSKKLSEERKEMIKDIMNTPNEAEASYGISVWLGAIIFYLLNGGEKTFEELYISKYETRNLIVGYLFQMILLFGFIALAFIL